MFNAFWIKLTHIEKTGSISFSFARKSDNKIPFSKLKFDHVVRDFDTFAVR